MFSDVIKYISSILGVVSTTYDENKLREGINECKKGYDRIRNAMRYAKTVGEKQNLEASLRNIKTLRNQLKAAQKKGAGVSVPMNTAKHRVHWDDTETAFNSRIMTGVISNLKHRDPASFLEDCKAIFKRRLQNALKENEAVKVNTVFGGEFVIAKGEQTINAYKYFTTPNVPIYRDTNLDKWFKGKVVEPIMRDLSEFQEQDSGWALKAIVNLGVNVNKYVPQHGSSYIELPLQIKRKQACINVKNEDEACFAWAVTSALFPVEQNAQRVSKYPHYSQVLKLKGIQFPMTMRQIPNFEKQNDISINVYILKTEKKMIQVLPSFLTENKRTTHVNLLLIQNKSESSITSHFVWIKDLSRLLSKQLNSCGYKNYFCDRCLHYFYSEEKLSNHMVDCLQKNKTATKMPEVGQHILKFKDHKYKIKTPFVVYSDMESVLKPTNDPKKIQEHIPAAIGYFFKCSYDENLSFYRSYRGEDCMQWFADEMNQLAEDVSTVFLCPYSINMSHAEEREFQAATHCHICALPFTPVDKKIRDHFHLSHNNNNSGKNTTNYRGAGHEGCNINYKDSHTIPVIFHCLSGYDAHFIISDIATRMSGSIDLLPINREKYISFTKHLDDFRINFRFIDSFRFMASSLNELSSYLTEFPNLKSQFATLPENVLSLITKKGVMPYDYFDCFERFNETSLPPIESFFNNLEGKPCSRRHYKRAHDVWNSFGCNTLGEYVDLYMKTDILLLTDIFEEFRTSCLHTYNLDPAHFFTLPGYTWAAMLKYTGQELELLTDQDMYLFVERGIRGGLSQVCSKRRAVANNKYMSNYDRSKPESYLMYYDINNQYGWAMSQYLPYGGFEWVDNNIDVMSVSDDSPEGYILEVDLKYSETLHNKHNDLPFCAEALNPKTMRPPTKEKDLTKLMATLHDKNKYVIHYRALKLALSHGLVLSKVHRVLKFKQSPWLKKYIDLNTNLRKAAKNEFEKNLFKLMNNAVFGKFLECVRKRVDLSLVTHWDGRYGAEARIARPEFKKCTIFNENLVAIEQNKILVYLNKPIYVGMSILDLAKTTIYSFHYDYMSHRFGENCSILYTDTDSLIYLITRDPYEVMREDCYQYFDTSDYPLDNIQKIPLVNKKVIGLMKDENNGKIMSDFVGLRSKLYATRLNTTNNEVLQLWEKYQKEEYDEDEIKEIIMNHDVTKKAKGVKKSVIKNKITFEDYVECLETNKHKITSQNLIRSEKHKVFTIKQEKLSLSCEDDKRYLIPGTFDTFAWGHFSIPHDHEAMDID